MSDLQDRHGHKLRYWTVAEIQNFCIEHDLVIATGLGGDDEAVITPKGRELYLLLKAVEWLDRERS